MKPPRFFPREHLPEKLRAAASLGPITAQQQIGFSAEGPDFHDPGFLQIEDGPIPPLPPHRRACFHGSCAPLRHNGNGNGGTNVCNFTPETDRAQ